MRTLRNVLLAGAGAALIGGAALAASERSHVLNVAMPDGGVAQIHYVGDEAPQVVAIRFPVTQVAAPIAMADPFAIFADFDRMSAMMDMQMAAMMRQAAAMQAQVASDAQQMRMVSADGAPAAGTVRYSYVSTTTSGNGCTTTVRYSSDGSGAEPRMIKTSSGACESGKDGDGAAPMMTSAPATPATPAAPETPKEIPGAKRI